MGDLLRGKNGIVYCICPLCGNKREKGKGKQWTIIKRGRERNGIARFFCKNCGAWFNSRTGHSMEWLRR